MIGLVRFGCKPASLSSEFGPKAWAIGLWAKQSARDASGGGLIAPSQMICAACDASTDR